MILRRVIAHFKKQEWTAIFLDFVIVVIGVFVGIQVSNWNAARDDRARTHSFLERIGGDLDADLVNYRDRLDFWAAVSAYGAKGLAYAETGDAKGASQWELLLAYFQASQVAEFYTTKTTFEELKSAGEVGLIADTGLRAALANHYAVSDNPVLSERPPYRAKVRGVVPLAVQTYIWSECYKSDTAARQQLFSCDAPIDDASAGAIVQLIAKDEALMAELRYWMSTMHVAALIGRDRMESAKELRARVDEALGARKNSLP